MVHLLDTRAVFFRVGYAVELAMERQRMSMQHKGRSSIWGLLLTASMLAAGASAQEADEADEADLEEVDEVIVVTGIRGSMQQSLERKRNADHFMDAITAEDIGAFPDQNLAESLQRVSGVAIDRKSGEGAFVSVRGLGPQFVQATINGRVSASNVSPGSHDGRGATNAGSRAVGFHAFQSGLVQAVEVHKSPRADHIEGGLGGFVDIQARKPLDLGERHIALALDTTRNELADDTAPGVFALYSDVLAEGVGFMVSAQWDNRVFRSDSLHHYSYLGDPRTVEIGGRELTGYYPRQLLGELHLTDRDRLNISSSLQLQPSDRVDVTFDLLYTDNAEDERDYWRDFRIQQGHGNITDASLKDDNGTGVFTMVSTSGAGLFVQHATEVVNTEAMNFGGNIEIQATDRLTVSLDATISATESPITNRDYLMRNTGTQMTYRKYGPGGMPSLTSSSPLTDPNWYQVVKHSIQDHLVDDQITQFRADATYEIAGNWLDTAQFGVRTYRQDRRDRHRYLNSRAFLRSPITEFGGNDPFPAESDFMDGLGNEFPAPILNPNLDVIQKTFTTRPDEILAGRGFNTGTAKSLEAFRTGRFNEDLNHEDDGNALYAMVMFSGNLGEVPYSGNFGIRYVDNNTGSEGEISEPISIDYSDPSAPEVILSEPRFVNVAHDYTEVLPALNLRFDPREDVVVRASVAKVLSRPRYLDLNPRQTVQARVRTMRGGNGMLDPDHGGAARPSLGVVLRGLLHRLGGRLHQVDRGVRAAGDHRRAVGGNHRSGDEPAPRVHLLPAAEHGRIGLDRLGAELPAHDGGPLACAPRRPRRDRQLHDDQLRFRLPQREDQRRLRHSGAVREHDQPDGVLREGYVERSGVLQLPRRVPRQHRRRFRPPLLRGQLRSVRRLGELPAQRNPHLRARSDQPDRRERVLLQPAGDGHGEALLQRHQRRPPHPVRRPRQAVGNRSRTSRPSEGRHSAFPVRRQAR